MASVYNTYLNGTVVLNNVANDNTQTNLLAVNGSGQVVYRSTTTVGVSTNQSLNTTNSATFNQITTNEISPNAVSVYFLPYMEIFQASISTTNNAWTTMLTLGTTNNTNYMVFAQVSMIDSVSGGACFVQTKRITNNAGVLDIGSVESYSNKSTSSSSTNMQIIASGSNLQFQVMGETGDTDIWALYVRIISSS